MIDVGILPIQVLEYAVVKFGADGGVYVSASHNEPEYNGFKFLKEDGAVLYVEQFNKFIEIARKYHPWKEWICRDLLTQDLVPPFAEKEFDWAIAISLKGSIFGQVKDNDALTQRHLQDWRTIEPKIHRVAKMILILEYGRRNAEVILCG